MCGTNRKIFDACVIQPKGSLRAGELNCSLTLSNASSNGTGHDTHAAHLNVVFQTPDQLPVHLPRLSHPDAPALGLAEAVLQDAAAFVGLLQLQPQLLQLVHLLLLEHVSHLQHLAAKLLHLILQHTTQESAGGGGGTWFVHTLSVMSTVLR